MSTPRPTLVAGVDVGSRHCRAVLAAENGEVLASAETPTRARPGEATRTVLAEAHARANATHSDIELVLCTGFGRRSVQADLTITEATAHGFAAARLLPGAATVIEMGAQHVNVLHTGTEGRVLAVRGNDRCAAGGGRFLERLARRLDLTLAELDGLVASATEPCDVSSVCSVLAESEVIGRLSEGAPLAGILAGAVASVAERTATQVKSLGLREPVVAVGGPAGLSSMVAALQRCLGVEVRVPQKPALTGALGAALVGWHWWHRKTRGNHHALTA